MSKADDRQKQSMLDSPDPKQCNHRNDKRNPLQHSTEPRCMAADQQQADYLSERRERDRVATEGR
eukprot:4867392-Alexandrium_andersonii.AAC.1